MATQEIDFAMNFEDSQQFEADKKLFVVFYTEPVRNEFETIKQGRPIFDDVHMIRIHTPGSRDTTVGVAHEGYQRRFQRQWDQYIKGVDQTTSGTPLSAVPWLTGAQVAELSFFNIKSVEQLAGMPDNVANKFPNHFSLKNQAQHFLDAAKGAAPLLQMQEELAKRDDQIAEMKVALAALTAKLDAEAAAKKDAASASKA